MTVEASIFVAEAPVYLTVEVEPVKVPEFENGLPEPDKIHARSPASSVVEEEMVRVPDTVIVPVPEFVVMVLDDPSFEKVKLLNIQFVPAVVAPKFLFPPVAVAVNVPADLFITPAVPVASPLTSTFPVPDNVPVVIVILLSTVIVVELLHPPPLPLNVRL